MTKFLKVLFVAGLLCLLKCGTAADAQDRPASPALPSSVMVYWAAYADDRSQISPDEVRRYGYDRSITDAAVIGSLLQALHQDGQPDLKHSPPVNASILVTCADTPETYTLGPGGTIWSGQHCYRLTASEKQTVLDLVYHQVFTREFLSKMITPPLIADSDGKWGVITLADDFDARTITHNAIIVKFEVDEHGHVQHPSLMQSCGNEELDADALDIVKHKTYLPAMEEGTPRRTVMAHQFNLGI